MSVIILPIVATPTTIMGQDFNFKLECLAFAQLVGGIDTPSKLELKTWPSFLPWHLIIVSTNIRLGWKSKVSPVRLDWQYSG